MDFTVIKYSGQGSFTVKKGTIDKLLFLLKTIASVNDPFPDFSLTGEHPVVPPFLLLNTAYEIKRLFVNRTAIVLKGISHTFFQMRLL